MSIQRFGLTDLLTCTRASTALVRSTAGVYSSVGNNVLRVSHEGGAFCLLAEETRTNSLPRNDMSGAVVGVVGSGGALPTGWSTGGLPAGAVEVMGTGTENGFPYFDVRLNGTPTSNVFVRFTQSAVVAAAPSQTWTASGFARMVAGSTTSIDTATFSVQQQNGVTAIGATLGADFLATFTDATRRFATRVFSAAATDNVVGQVRLGWTSGAIDITLRVYAPQLEQGAFATSPIITSGSAVTRQQDQVALNAGLLAQVYGGGPVSVLTEFEMVYTTGGSGFPRVWSADSGSADNRISILVSESAGETLVTTRKDDTTLQLDFASYTSGAALKIATRFETDNAAVSRNGAAVTTDTSVTLPTGLINLGLSNEGFNPASQRSPLLRLRKFVLYPAALSNAELEALSA